MQGSAVQYSEVEYSTVLRGSTGPQWGVAVTNGVLTQSPSLEASQSAASQPASQLAPLVQWTLVKESAPGPWPIIL